LQYVEAHPSAASAGELAALAIEEWLARGELNKAPLIRHRGYQWKSLFLPEGTQLRTWNSTGFAYAEVIGDSTMHQGESVTSKIPVPWQLPTGKCSHRTGGSVTAARKICCLTSFDWTAYRFRVLHTPWSL
jgi:hypothetical protein